MPVVLTAHPLIYAVMSTAHQLSLMSQALPVRYIHAMSSSIMVTFCSWVPDSIHQDTADIETSMISFHSIRLSSIPVRAKSIHVVPAAIISVTLSAAPV